MSSSQKSNCTAKNLTKHKKSTANKEVVKVQYSFIPLDIDTNKPKIRQSRELRLLLSHVQLIQSER